MNDLEFAVGILSHEIQKFQENDQLIFEISNRPELHIHSLDPLIYDRYGLIRQKGPMVVGRVVLETLLTATSADRDGGRVYIAAKAGRELYGFRAGLVALNSLAETVGRPDIRFLHSGTSD